MTDFSLRHGRVPFRLSSIATVVLMACGPAYAADPTVAELQAEIARLKQIIAAQGGAVAEPVAVAPTSVPASTPEPEEAQTLGELTVRARNRLERLKEVPVSISVVSGNELDNLQARDVASITQRAANVSWNQGNARTSAISIRGLGKQAQTDAMDPSVGITVDGVSYAYNPLSSFDFYDVDAVEVLRGPQGTLYGKNASMGAINITTRKPTFTPDSSFSLALGENNRVIANAAVGGPLIDNLLAWRAAFTVDKGQGVYPNAYNGDFGYKNKDNVSGRVQFLLTPTADFSALLKLEVTPRHEEYYNGWTFFTPTPTQYANGLPNPLSTDAATRLTRRWFQQQADYTYAGNYLAAQVNQDNQRPLVTATNGASATLTWKLGEYTLTSISGYKDFYFQARNDEGTPFDISKNGGGYVSRNAQVSEELRLTSPVGGAVDYQTGLYLLSQKNNYSSRTGFGSDAGAWFATGAQYTALDKDGAGRYLLQNSLSRLETNTPQDIHSKSAALYGQANWHVSERLTVTGGLRITAEDRKNSSTKFIAEEGFGSELDPAVVNGIATGGFNSDANGNLAVNGNTAAQLALANLAAQKYFGVAYAALTTDQKKQLAAAKAIRAANIGVVYNTTRADTIHDRQPTILLSPSYRINDNVTSYVSLQYGEKAGIAQVINGYSNNARPEKSTSYEIGVKTTLLDKKLTLSADLFLNNIKDYQQAVQVYDAYTTAQKSDGTLYYTAATGNAAKVRAQGLEFDGVYSGLPNTVLRFSGAYNDAYYKDFKNSSNPLEMANLATPYRDVTGQNLPGAAKFTFNVGGEYRAPVKGWNKEFHANFNTAYSSKYNSDVSLSSYAWVPAYSITDFGIGLGTLDKKFDVTLLAKNLFDDRTSQVVTWNSYVPAVGRWVGIVFSGKL
ncbi:TonB-dependent receptor [Duganella sp. CY15W]|uniref:TonB-dependent receptor n=1 Tax=Duganella sp. CY15W TaxID=2692172 RepID=UPI00136DDE41|nr:TonB-dependent receptor [Duganella sp. CY15W]MYM29112.1 TonB-dependent receptor [Duganella sp. CY15W]